MESVFLGGCQVRAFNALPPDGSLGENVSVNKATPVIAAAMVGATAGLLAHVLKAKTGYAILLGAGAAVIAHYGIEKASEA